MNTPNDSRPLQSPAEAEMDRAPELGVAPGSALQDFRSQVMGEWVDYYPKDGELCEYRIRGDEWIPCEIIREERRNPTRYFARYVSHTGQLKTGIVGSCNLRPSPQNTAHEPRAQRE